MCYIIELIFSECFMHHWYTTHRLLSNMARITCITFQEPTTLIITGVNPNFPLPQQSSCSYKQNGMGATMTGSVSIAYGAESDLQSALANVGPISVAVDASSNSFKVSQCDTQCSSYRSIECCHRQTHWAMWLKVVYIQNLYTWVCVCVYVHLVLTGACTQKTCTLRTFKNRHNPCSIMLGACTVPRDVPALN